MKKICKILSAAIIGAACLTAPTIANAVVYNKPDQLINFSNEYMRFTVDSFSLGKQYAVRDVYHGTGYTKYQYYPNSNNNKSLKIKINLDSFSPVPKNKRYLPFYVVSCYDAKTGKCVEAKIVDCKLNENYISFDNLTPYNNYYLTLNISSDTSIRGQLFISRDGLYNGIG